MPPRVTHTEPPATVTEFGRPPTATRRVTRPAGFAPAAGGAVVAVLAVLAVSVPPPSPPPPSARAATTASARTGIAASAQGSQRRPPCSDRGAGASEPARTVGARSGVTTVSSPPGAAAPVATTRSGPPAPASPAAASAARPRSPADG